MVPDWQDLTLGDFVTLQRGHDLPETQRVEGNIPILGSFGITGWHNEAKTKGPGVTIGRSGGSFGVVSYSPVDYWPLNTALYVKDFHGNDPKFAYYFLRTIDFKQYNTGSAQPSLNRNHIHPIPIRVPGVSEQKSIAHILGTLDDKIELNRQMNATLEAMAQALFKSWFVDFDPVIDNALAAGNPIPEPLQTRAETRKALGDKRKPLPEAIQQQFPSRFVFSEEMGWVPEGWEVGTFGDVATHVRDNVNAEEVSDFDFYVGLEHIGRKQLFLTDSSTGESIESNKSHFAENDLLFGKLRPYFHKLCIAPQEGICSTDILVFRAKQPSQHAFMTMTAFREEFVAYANLRSTGTRMPRANAKDILAYPIIIPRSLVTTEFEALISPFWERGMQSVIASNKLAKLRDTLLPKLLSGQLRIPDAEAMVEQAAAG